jgi:hypothetical protein
MKLTKLTFILTFLLLISTSAFSQSTSQSSPNPNTLTENEKKELLTTIEKNEHEYDSKWGLYRFAYLGSTLLAALLAALAGILPKIKTVNPDEPEAKKKQLRNENISLILAATATFLLLVNTTVGFSAIGIANRNARDSIGTLRSDIEGGKVASKGAGDIRIHEIETKKSQDAVK